MRVGPELREPRRTPGWTSCSRSSMRYAARTASTGRTSGSSCSPSTPTPLTGCTRVLAQRGYADRLAVIQGSTPPEDREYIRSQFTADPAKEPVRVLLATDAAGEGIDLQTHCHRLVNFDIPFNPSRLGAAHRPHRPLRADPRAARSFTSSPRPSPPPTPPTPTSWPASPKKVANVEQDLGSVNQVIGDEIQHHFARRAPAKRKAKGVDAQRGDQHRAGGRHGTQRAAHPAGAGL